MRLSWMGMMASGGDRSACHRRADPVGRAGTSRRARQLGAGPVLRRSQQRQPQGADDAARHRRRGSRPDHREPAVPHEDRSGREERAAGRPVPVAQAPRRRDADDGGRRAGTRWRHSRAPTPVLLALAGLVACAGASAQPAHGGPRAAASPAAASAAGRRPAHRLRLRRRRAHRPAQGAAAAAASSTARRVPTPASSATTTSRRATRARRSSRASMRIATTSARPFGPGGLQCEACHGPGARHARSKNPESINSLKAELVADGAGTQPDLPRLPPGRCEDRLARQHARAQRRRLRRLPPGAPGP